jgi:HPr kinase/phosphorylase
MPRLSISELLSETEAGLDLELLAGERGLSRVVQVPRIQKPGLALAGYTKNLHPDRIQVLAGVEAGETIAVAAVTQLQEGMTVRPMTTN